MNMKKNKIYLFFITKEGISVYNIISERYIKPSRKYN